MIRGFLFGYLMLHTVYIFGQYEFEATVNSPSKRVFLELEVIDELRLFNSENTGEFQVKESGLEQNRKLSFVEKDGSLHLVESRLDLGNIEEEADKVCSIEPEYNTYELYVPERTEVFLSIVEGNFRASSFHGQLNLMIEKGIIRMQDPQGDSKIKINAGKVFIRQPENTIIDAETNLGMIVADEQIGMVSKNKKSMNTEQGNGKNSMLIRAILANIYFNTL